MYDTITSRLQQRCQVSYYPAVNQEIIFDLDWDDVEQVVVLVQGTRYTIVRNDNIEGDLTLRNILVQFGYGQCIIHLTPYYEIMGMKIENVIDTTVHELEVVQLQIYRDMDVFNAMIPGWDVPIDARAMNPGWEYEVPNAVPNEVPNEVPNAVPNEVPNEDIDNIYYDKDINIDQIARELEDLAFARAGLQYDTTIVNYTHYAVNHADNIEYDSIAHRVAEFVLSE